MKKNFVNFDSLFTEEGEGNVEKRLIEIGKENFKAQFNQVFRDMEAQLIGLERDYIKFCTNSADDIKTNKKLNTVDNIKGIINARLDYDALEKEMETAKEIYKEFFKEDLVK